MARINVARVQNALLDSLINMGTRPVLLAPPEHNHKFNIF